MTPPRRNPRTLAPYHYIVASALTCLLGCTGQHVIGAVDGSVTTTCPLRFSQLTTDSGDYPGAAVVQDVSGDGHQDVVVANTWLGGLSVLLGQGNGSFVRTPYPLGSYVFSLAVAKLNADQWPDVAAARFGGNLLLGQGEGVMRDGGIVPGTAVWIAAGDVNGDGPMDLVTISRPVTQAVDVVTVLIGEGDGTFTQSLMPYTAGARLRSVQVQDVDGDQRPDIVLLSLSMKAVVVLLGKGDGTFVPGGTYPVGDQTAAPMGGDPLVIGDMDNDGKPDLVLVSPGQDTVSVLHNIGPVPPLFGAPKAYPTGRGPASVALADLDGDGNLDAVVANQGAGTVSLLLGAGGGTLGTACSYPVGASPGAVAVGDLDGDRRADFVVSNWSAGNLSVFLNNQR